MHHGTCMMHVLLCMSGSLTHVGLEKNIPGIPSACTTRSFAYLARGPWDGQYTAFAYVETGKWGHMPNNAGKWCITRSIGYYGCARLSATVGGTLLLAIIWLNTLRPRQNGRHIPDDIFKCIFFSENVWNSLKISLRFVPNGPINNIPALVQIMAWRRSGNKPLSEPMMVSLLTHICVTRSQWVNKPYIDNLLC